jgi:hypothetical protein
MMNASIKGANQMNLDRSTKLWLAFGAGVFLFALAGGSSTGYQQKDTSRIEPVTAQERTNKEVDDIISVTASMMIYDVHCAKLPPEMRLMAGKVYKLQMDSVVTAGLIKQRERQQLGDTVWCAHWSNVIKQTLEETR